MKYLLYNIVPHIFNHITSAYIIFQLQRQLSERGGGVCLSDQESLVSFPRSSVNGGAATPGAGSSSGGVQPQTIHGSASELVVLGSAVPLSSTGASCTGQPGDRGSCSADSGVRGSSDRESGGATSIGGNLSDSTTDGGFLQFYSFFFHACFHNIYFRPLYNALILIILSIFHIGHHTLTL